MIKLLATAALLFITDTTATTATTVDSNSRTCKTAYLTVQKLIDQHLRGEFSRAELYDRILSPDSMGRVVGPEERFEIQIKVDMLVEGTDLERSQMFDMMMRQCMDL